MYFSIQKELFHILPHLTIGMVVAAGVDNTHPSREIETLLSNTIEEMKRGFWRIVFGCLYLTRSTALTPSFLS